MVRFITMEIASFILLLTIISFSSSNTANFTNPKYLVLSSDTFQTDENFVCLRSQYHNSYNLE